MCGQKLIEQLNKEVERGMVRRAYSEDGRLAIYTYTPKCEFENEWTPIQRMCRGLVVNAAGKIIIRCVPKFYNMGDSHAPDKVDIETEELKGGVIYTEKNDGYLIQIKNDSEYGLIVTSKGSFTSKYVQFVKEYIRESIPYLEKDWTYICELCCNFEGDEGIIVTKHDVPRLIVWEVLDADGHSIIDDFYLGSHLPPNFELTRRFNAFEYLDYMQREDVEGTVLVFPETLDPAGLTPLRVKHKTDAFFIKHRAISQCTKKHCFELWAKGDNLQDLPIPDEFMKQMQNWYKEFDVAFTRRKEWVKHWTDTLSDLSDKGLAQNTSLAFTPAEKSMLFASRNGKPDVVESLIRKEIKATL